MPDVLIVHPNSTSAQLKQVLLDRIVTGYYPLGSKLPSVREIASDLGINRNTVSKVYRELARDGITRLVAGKGVFVQTRPDVRAGDNFGHLELDREITEVARRARLYGLSQGSFMDLVSRAAAQTFQDRTIAFVECNTADAVELARDLGLYLGERVDPVPLAELQKRPQAIAQNYDLICTTFFHLTEINETLPGAEHKIFGVQVTPRAEVLLKLTRYTAQHRLGIVVANRRTLESVLRIIQTYCQASVEPIILSEVGSKLSFPRKIDAVVDTLSTHELVARRFKKVPHITITYRADSQSLLEIRHRLLERSLSENQESKRLDGDRRN